MLNDQGVNVLGCFHPIPRTLKAYFRSLVAFPGQTLSDPYCDQWDRISALLVYNDTTHAWEGQVTTGNGTTISLSYSASFLGAWSLALSASTCGNITVTQLPSPNECDCKIYQAVPIGTCCGVGYYDFAVQIKIFNPAAPCPCPPNAAYTCDCGCSCSNGDAAPLDDGMSDNPIRYATGEIALGSNDLATAGFGADWGHTRTFSNRLSDDVTLGNGYNWQIAQWGYWVHSNGAIAILGRANGALWFDPSGSSYAPRYSTRKTLKLDSANNVYRLEHLDGSVDEFSWVTGQFRRHTEPGGDAVEVVSLAANGFNIAEVQRQTLGNGTTAVESLVYGYDSPSSPDAQLTSITLQRQVNGGSWTNVTQTIYTYYGASDPNGRAGDLQTVTTQVWENGAWVSTGTTMYRYFKQPDPGPVSSSSSSSSSSNNGGNQLFDHLLKYVVLPASYDRLAADPSVTNPLTASDAIVSLYADYYFEYDQNRRVTKEVVQSGSRTFLYSYTASTNGQGYNSWATKTVETLPDGDKNVIYSNYAGQTMLKVFQSGGLNWCDFYQYDSTGQAILHAKPSAVSGYDESYADLLHQVSGNYQYLRDSDGFIETFQYHTPTGWLQSALIQQGELGTPIKLRDLAYTQCCTTNSSSSSSSSSSSPEPGSGAVTPCRYVLSSETVYPSDTDQTQTIVTSYSRTFYSGTCAVQQQTMTLPVISTSQNGSGVANTSKDYFDIYGNLTWHMDERGFLTRYTYDIATGAVTQRIDDVDTTQVSDAPAGWSTPSGGGLHLVTDFTIDALGRTVQELGPSHVIDLSGVATTIRRATWTVYQDSAHQVWAAQGYATGSSPSYTYTLVNPVSITIMDAGGKVLESIQATRSSTSGALSASDSFPQSSYVRWTTTQYTDCCLVASERVYHTIPSSGAGTPGTNYDETDFGYDVMKRRVRTTSPGGTITYNVLDGLGRVTATCVGTNDNGATDSDPTGGGATGNNMVVVTGLVYDGGGVGDSNLTQRTDYVDSSGTQDRITAFGYDWRDRLITTDGEIDFYEVRYYDNLDRVTRIERYDTIGPVPGSSSSSSSSSSSNSGLGNLIGRLDTKYDDLSRVFQQIRYGVDPTTGTVGNSLVDNFWYDQAGNMVKKLPSGSNLWTKTTFDGINRPTGAYTGFGTDSTYSAIFSVAGDVVLEQVEDVYDAASNRIQETQRQRYHNAPTTDTGALASPSATPKARVVYSAAYPDPLGRLQATADYGTNGGSTLTRSSTIPGPSDTVLVSSQSYDNSGNLLQTTDPAGMVTRYGYDAAGRRTQVIENYQTSSSSSSSSSVSGCGGSADTNRTTNLTYTADGLVATLQALNTSTGNQTTTYNYGTTLSNSAVASSILLRSTVYPDSVSGSDQVTLAYDRQSQRTSLADQNGSVHTYAYDLLGRLTEDRITTLGTNVDGAVRRIETAYEVRGLVNRITSFDSATVGTGSVVNETTFSYNQFEQSVNTYQSHSGSVNVLSTPSVRSGYADGSSNTIRPTSLTYPNGRVLTYDYGVSASTSNQASRIAGLIDSDAGSTHLADYSYLGLARVVEQSSPAADLEYTLVSLTGSNDPDTGDIYAGLDRFGRTKDIRWRNTSAGTDLSRVQYGYDRASNRTWRLNPSDPNEHFDWLYAHDGLHRLDNGQRGTLDSTHSSITSPQFTQCWTLDETGNWGGFRQSNDGVNWSLVQARTANPANELAAITTTTGTSWATPSYDANGNMSSIPQPSAPASSYGGSYDAWNRLVKLVDSGTGNTVQVNQLDGRGYRIVTNSYNSGILTETRHAYFTDTWQNVEERVGTSTSADRQYVWGVQYIDNLVLRDRSVSGGILNERLYSLQDANWNVTAVADITGTIQERYEFSPYGAPSFLTADFDARPQSGYAWETLYSGYRYDQTSALFQVRHRVYVPSIGAWGQRDPLSYRDSTNLYLYLGAEPTGLTDPLGLGLVIPIAIGVGIVLAAGIVLYNGTYISYDYLSADERKKINELLKALEDGAPKDNPKMKAAFASCSNLIWGKWESTRMTTTNDADGKDAPADTVTIRPSRLNRTRIYLKHKFFEDKKCYQMYVLTKECYLRAQALNYVDMGLADNNADATFLPLECALGCCGEVNPARDGRNGPYGCCPKNKRACAQPGFQDVLV